MTDPEYTEIWERGGVLWGLVCLFVCLLCGDGGVCLLLYSRDTFGRFLSQVNL